MKPKQAYEELVRLSKEEALLASCADLLEWDQEVSMPRKGVKHRAEQLVLLAGLSHDRATNPRYDELLSILEQSALVNDPDSAEAVNVRELRRGYDRERRIPRRLVEEMAHVTSMASDVWIDSKKKDDFKSFAPWLDRIFALAREEADAAGHNGSRYDALLEDYEPGMTTEYLSGMLSGLAKDLVPMIDVFRDRPVRRLTGKFPVDLQRKFGEHVAAAVGFDLKSARLDIGQHPFCTVIGPGDVRIALRFSAGNIAGGILTLLHEVGHGLYDQGLDPRHFGMPMGDAASLGLHESQSRLWENFVGRSEGFWRWFYPLLSETFPNALGNISLETFRESINGVAPGVIRVEADELTYNLHIVIRFELERAMIDGGLVAADLPGAWAELYQRYLGIAPKDDRTGCLQDIHWAEGLIGYFPTYSLGNVYAAQLYAAAERQVGALEESFARGDFSGLREWLRENVHRHGMNYRAATIVERATGSLPNPSALVDSLRKRYQ